MLISKNLGIIKEKIDCAIQIRIQVVLALARLVVWMALVKNPGSVKVFVVKVKHAVDLDIIKLTSLFAFLEIDS